jgi:hypothetical protein
VVVSSSAYINHIHTCFMDRFCHLSLRHSTVGAILVKVDMIVYLFLLPVLMIRDFNVLFKLSNQGLVQMIAGIRILHAEI